jgi:DNA primase
VVKLGALKTLTKMDEVEQVKSKVDLVDLISEYLPLKKAGRNLKAACPFHLETSPSFMVSPDLQIWRCFGCGKGGDAYTFLEEKEGMTFPEALEYLAKRVGVTIKRKISQGDDSKAKLYQINELAARFYNYLLVKHKVGEEAREYLKRRKISEKSIEKFEIGYAPKAWETLLKFLSKKYQLSDISNSGLLVAKEKGGFYDRFRGRLMFPIKSAGGEIVGFSGRVLKDESSEPKYINTPETKIFSKGRILYGLHLARASIKHENEAILVEGEFDAIASHQAGVENAVATKGTALTENQVTILSRLCDNLSICFDTDLAGDAAARRGIELADSAGLNIKVIQLEKAKDPADLISQSPNLWQKAVSKAIPVFDFLISSALRRNDQLTAQGKKQIAGELLPILGKITDEVVKAHYLSKLASQLEVGEEVLRKEMEKKQDWKDQNLGVKFEDSSEVKKGIMGSSKQDRLEEYFLALLFQGKDFKIENNLLPPLADIQNPSLKNLYKMSIIPPGTVAKKNKGFSKLTDEEIEIYKRLSLVDLSEIVDTEDGWLKEVKKISQSIKKESLKGKLELLTNQIKKAEEGKKEKELDVLKKRFRDLSLELANI